MALPIWAHRRGKLYDTVVMQDKPDKELWLGFHEAYSSPDPYYCRPMSFDEIDVDAISCPTIVFNSVKGRLDPDLPKSYYPPRNDLMRFTDRDCDEPGQAGCTVGTSAKRYGDINDIDAVATATPPYGSPFRGAWSIPAELPDGDYALFVEVNKEFDNNARHGWQAGPQFLSYQDPNLSDSGLRTNFGQPSVLFRVPIRIDHAGAHQGAVTDIAGYGDWNGANGTLTPADATISDSPGSGKGRLLVVAEPALAGGTPLRGRVVATSTSSRQCTAGGGRGEISGLEVPADTIAATEVDVRFIEADDAGSPVERYELRFAEGDTMSAETFASARPAPSVPPTQPGRVASVHLGGLKPSTHYVLGARAIGCCIGAGAIAFVTFQTADRHFTQLSGCFVATAAYGSALEPHVQALRRLRDEARARSGLGAAAIHMYERASPPVAALLRESPSLRALVRGALGPVAGTLAAHDGENSRGSR
jgi:hypothetical protein